MHAIEVQGLDYTWPGGRKVLANIDFNIADGETVAIVGPSGAGKSTLLMHLNGLLPDRPPTDTDPACIAVHGTPLRRSTLSQIRQQVGFVFQDPDDQLFCPTVQEDVAFGPLNMGLDRAAVLHRVDNCLARVGLPNHAHRSTLQLSQGERKRVCLAGVLACEPRVLVMDEPFANLDPRARRSLVTIIRDFRGARVFATHDLNLVVELCDRVIVLDEGRIHAIGDVRAVLSDAVLMETHGLEVPWNLQQ